MVMTTKTNKGETMKIKVIEANHWIGTHFKVILNGVKYPKARGEYYQPFGNSEHDKKKLAIKWCIAENEGKYLSCGGILYNSKEEYLKKQDEYLEEYLNN